MKKDWGQLMVVAEQRRTTLSKGAMSFAMIFTHAKEAEKKDCFPKPRF
jgi:hypothetical protein